MAIVINFAMTTAVKNMERESLKLIIALSAVESWWKMIKEAMINFGIDISREAVEKYAFEKFGRLPQSHIEMNFARDSKIVEETRRFMSNEEIKK